MGGDDTWSKVEDLPADFDLDLLVLVLNRNDISHRLQEVDGGMQLWIEDSSRQDEVRTLIRRMDKLVEVEEGARKQGLLQTPAPAQFVQRLPVTLLTIVLCVFGLVIAARAPGLLTLMTFTPFELISGRGATFEPLQATLDRGEYWRFLSPAFLHFGPFHLVFNCLWLWEFGRRVELLIGSGAYLILLLCLSTGSNMGQYLWSGPGMFGGLSGAVYGVIGYVWVRSALAPHPLLRVSRPLIYLMVIWLILGLLGIIDLFIPHGGVANGAHLSGFLIGLVAGAMSSKKPAGG